MNIEPRTLRLTEIDGTHYGCALTCPHEKMKRNVREWLGKEYGA